MQTLLDQRITDDHDLLRARGLEVDIVESICLFESDHLSDLALVESVVHALTKHEAHVTVTSIN